MCYSADNITLVSVKPDELIQSGVKMQVKVGSEERAHVGNEGERLTE